MIQNLAEVPYNLKYPQEDKPLEGSNVKVVPLHATKAYVIVEVYKLHELFTLAILGCELISFGLGRITLSIRVTTLGKGESTFVHTG